MSHVADHAPFADVIRDVVRFDDLDGVGGDDTMLGGSGDDIMHGQRGDDDMSGESGADEMYGELGDDTMSGGSGRDVMLGDTGTITRVYNADGSPTLNPNGSWHKDVLLTDVAEVTDAFEHDGTALVDGVHAADVLASDFVVVLPAADDDGAVPAGARDILLADLVSGGDDVMDGDGDADLLFGQRGNDTMSGGGGADYLEGGAGNDVMDGDAGNDILLGDDGANVNPALNGLPHAVHGLDLIDLDEDAGVDLSGHAEVFSPEASVIPHAMLHDDDFIALIPHVVTDFASHAQELHDEGIAEHEHHILNRFDLTGGDDVMRGGDDDDVLLGDYGTNVLPDLLAAGIAGVEGGLYGSVNALGDLKSELRDVEAGLLGVVDHLRGLEDASHDASNELEDALADLSEIVYGNTAEGHDDQGLDLIGGNDWMDGGGGNDSMIGDSAAFIGTFLSGQHEHAHDGGHHNIVSGFNLIGGNDTMLGGGGDDEMVGDNVAIIAPGADISTQEVFDETVIAHKGHFHDTGLFHERTQQGHFDVVSGLSIIGGNDEMDGGAGNDVMRGDNNVILAPSVTITSSITYADAGVVVDAEVIDPGDPHDIISDLFILGGNDTMTGGAGDDSIIGDNSVLITPVVSVTQDVVHEDTDDGKKRKKHKSKDPHLNHDVHKDLVDDLVDGITIIGGNDFIWGGLAEGEVVEDTDDDVLVGDNSVLVNPFVEWTRLETFNDDGLKDHHHHGKGHHKGHHGGHPHGVPVDGQDLVGAIDIIGGNDLMDGGAGADLMLGDNATLIAPFAAITLNKTQTHNPSGKHKHHHDHDDDEDGFGHESPDDLVGSVNVTGGNDTMSGGLGDDTMFGDNATVVAPFLELTLNTEHDDDHHKGKHGRHGHGKHHGHHGHHNGPHSVLGDLTVVGGNDILDGGSGDDLMTGDNSTLIAPMVNSTLNVTHAEDHDHGKHKHHKRHGHDDHGAFQGSVVNGLSVTGGNDTLMGGGDDDLITGDNATVIAPDVVLNLNGTHPDDGKHHGKHHDDHNDHDGGLFGNVVGHAHVSGGDDIVDGGEGNDFIVGAATRSSVHR